MIDLHWEYSVDASYYRLLEWNHWHLINIQIPLKVCRWHLRTLCHLLVKQCVNLLSVDILGLHKWNTVITNFFFMQINLNRFSYKGFEKIRMPWNNFNFIKINLCNIIFKNIWDKAMDCVLDFKSFLCSSINSKPLRHTYVEYELATIKLQRNLIDSWKKRSSYRVLLFVDCSNKFLSGEGHKLYIEFIKNPF